MVWCCHVISLTLLNTTLCVHHFLFCSFTASDGSEGTTADCAVLPCSILVDHGFRTKEVRHARKQNIDYAKQHHTSHHWLPTKVMYPTYSTNRFSWLTLSIFVVEECSERDVYIVLLICK